MERENLGTILIISGEVAVLNGFNNKLQVSQGEQQTQYSWHSIQLIALYGPHQITTPALRQAMKHNIPVYFINNYGSFEGVATANQPSQGGPLWLLQANYCQHHEFALKISKELVLARISGLKTIISRRDPKWHDLVVFSRLEEKVHNALDLNSLRGYEGQAAKLLWQYFSETLDESWHFTGRNRQPPKDPVNVVLSSGYTLLYNLIDAAIRVSGLYPWQGVYHQPRGTHAALASDLIEPFRVLVERTVLTLINKGQIKPDDFNETEKGCHISSEARKCLFNALLVALTEKSKKDKPRLLDVLFKQPVNLVDTFRHKNTFRAWRP